MIGSLGPVVFVATEKTLRTFDEFTRTSAGRWSKHEVLGKKPLTQWIGPGLDTISFTMRFDARFGLNPRKELDALVELEREGKAMALTIGGKGLGVNLWVITSLEQNWEVVGGKGELLVATANISLEEYVAVVKK
jgi:phage protein U